MTTWLRKWERTKGSGFTHSQINAMLKKTVTDAAASPLVPLPLGGATVPVLKEPFIDGLP